MLRFAAANLASRPGRTLLATLGLTIAIAGMVGLFAIAGGIDALLESTLARIPGIIVLQPGAPIPMFSVLPAAWEDELAAVEGVGVVNPEVWTRVNLLDGKPVLSPPRLLMGTDPRTRARLKHGVYSECLESGRFLEEQDVNQPHVVISRQIAVETGKTVGDPLEVNGRTMTIIGIYHCGSLLLDVTVIADITVVRDLARIDSKTVNAFYIEPAGDVATDTVVQRIKDRFAGHELPAWNPSGAGAFPIVIPPLTIADFLKRLIAAPAPTPASARSSSTPSVESDVHHTPNGDNPAAQSAGGADLLPLEVRSVTEWGEHFSDLTADLDWVLALLTGLGIAIAVSSILNTMMMSVSERTVEFGILRANGWSQADIVRLITCESALLGVAGGLLGITCGWIATQTINHVWSDRAHLYAGPVLLIGSLLFSVGVGVLGGLYPAIRAARMSPMNAIRRG